MSSILCLSLAVDLVSTTQAQDTEFVESIIVRYRSPQRGQELAARLLTAQDVASRRGFALRYGRAGALETHVLTVDRPMSLAEATALAREIVANDPNVEYAEPDARAYPAFVPNDPRYNEQWHYFEGIGGINLPDAWDLSTGAGVTVAVLDTGYRPHPDLIANIVGGYDFISDPGASNDGNGRDADAQDPGDYGCGSASSWHGTHTAGTIAARTNNGTGVAGVAFNSRIVAARVLGRCGGSVSDIADAIIWSVGGPVPGVPANGNRAEVLNLSLSGSGSCGSTLQNAITYATWRDAVVVVAAGNSNANAANYFPANCNGVITVAATDRGGNKAAYSNYGATVEIAAPGGATIPNAANGVLSTLNTGTTTPGTDNYAFYQGTSMGTPHVSGVAALMLSANPALTRNHVLQLLQSTARSFPGTCSQCGSGIVDAKAAVSAALVIRPTIETATVTVGHCAALGISFYGFGPAISAPPYIQCPAIGSLSPATLAGGKQITILRDACTYTTSFTFQVSGFASDPGPSWLFSLAIDGVTKTPQDIGFSYSYSGGVATFQWPSAVYACGGAPATATVVLGHQ